MNAHEGSLFRNKRATEISGTVEFHPFLFSSSYFPIGTNWIALWFILIT
jgi:hypothetical protein